MKIRADKHIEADDGSQIPLGIHRLADRIRTGPFWAGRGIRAFAVLMPTPKRPREDECMDPYIMGDVVFTKPAGGRDWPIFGGGGMWDKYLDGGSGGVIGGG